MTNSRYRITTDELLSWLENCSLVRRRAILFGLETKLPLDSVISLTWKELNQLNLPLLPNALANLNPRHIKLNYVFWETVSNLVVAPLFGLADTIYEITNGIEYDTLSALYQDMIRIDRKSDFEHFTKNICAELNLRMGNN